MLFSRLVVMVADWPRSARSPCEDRVLGLHSNPALLRARSILPVAPLTWAQTRSIRARSSSVSSIGTRTSRPSSIP